MLETYEVAGGPIKFGSKFQPSPRPPTSLGGTVSKIPLLGRTEPTQRQTRAIWGFTSAVVWVSVFMVEKEQRKRQALLAIGTTGCALAAAGLMGRA